MSTSYPRRRAIQVDPIKTDDITVYGTPLQFALKINKRIRAYLDTQLKTRQPWGSYIKISQAMGGRRQNTGAKLDFEAHSVKIRWLVILTLRCYF
jgi:hypothetical protein